jgi:hypothetical protein
LPYIGAQVHSEFLKEHFFREFTKLADLLGIRRVQGGRFEIHFKESYSNYSTERLDKFLMLRKDRQLGALAAMQKKQKDSQKKADWD